MYAGAHSRSISPLRSASLALLAMGCWAADGDGLTGTYFANTSFSGEPVLTRVDGQVNFDWSTGSPDALLPSDFFSVRWRGRITAPQSDTYTFTLRGDDGCRLWVNGHLVIDDWAPHAARDSVGAISLVGGQSVSIEIEYFENGGYASEALSWSTPTLAKQLVPQSALSSDSAPGTSQGTGLSARYFANTTLSGSPVLERTDAQVNFLWGSGAPAPSLPADYFSVSWDGYVQPRFSEEYTFTTLSDDGCRVWFDGKMVTNDWTLHSQRANTFTVRLEANKKYPIRIAFYEQTGQATLALAWQSASEPYRTIQRELLYPAGDVVVRVPESSYTSPVCVEGATIGGWEGVTATAQGAAQVIKPLGKDTFYVNLPLQDGADTAVSIAAGSTVTTGSVAWLATDPVAQNGASSPIRVGDSMKFLIGAGRTLVLQANCGTSTFDGDVHPVVVQTFAEAGHYTAEVRDASDAIIGMVQVQVIGLALPAEAAGQKPAGEIGITQHYEIPVTPSGSADQLNFFTNSPLLTIASTTAAGAETAGIDARPTGLYYNIVAGRAGVGGPILGSVEFQEYKVDRSAMALAPVIGWIPGPFPQKAESQAYVRVTPYFPGLRFDFQMFAHTSTFVNGATSFTVRTDNQNSSIGQPGFIQEVDPDSGEMSGVFYYSIISPQGETMYCHRSQVTQE